MSSQAIRLMAEEVRELGFAAILGAGVYSGVGTAIDHPARMIVIQNLTDADVMFSFNGVTDHLPLRQYTSLVLDITGNKTTTSGFYLAEGQRLYVTQIGVPTVGSVYLTVFYGRD